MLDQALTRSTARRLCIGLDQGPDGLLLRALHEAGLPSDMIGFDLPEKTTMWVAYDAVDVAQGAGARSERIYSLLPVHQAC